MCHATRLARDNDQRRSINLLYWSKSRIQSTSVIVILIMGKKVTKTIEWVIAATKNVVCLDCGLPADSDEDAELVLPPSPHTSSGGSSGGGLPRHRSVPWMKIDNLDITNYSSVRLR